MQWSCATWNSCALLGTPFNDRGRIGFRRAQLDKLISEVDIVGVQEAHGCQESLDHFLSMYPIHLARGSFCSSRSAGGVVTFIAPHFARRFPDWTFQAIEEGRCAFLTGRSDNGNIQVVSCQVLPAHGPRLRITLFNKILAALNPGPDSLAIMMGDWNAPTSDEGIY